MTEMQTHTVPTTMAEARHAWTNEYVRANGIRTRYVVAGKGEPVVFMHGGALGATGETNFWKNIGALAQHFRVYAFDAIGFGYSDKPDIPYDDLVYRDHLLWFLDALCLDRVALIGQSRGASVACFFAVDRPERVSKMVLVNGPFGAMGIANPRPAGRVTQDGHLKRLISEGPTREIIRDVLGGLMDPNNIPEELVEERLAMAQMPGALNQLNYRFTPREPNPSAEQRENLEGRLSKLTIPMLLFWGKNDRVSPIEAGYAMRDMLPNLAVFYAVDDAAHHVQTDQAEFFNEKTIEFLLS